MGADFEFFKLKIIDAHVHGFPDRLFEKIWAYFEQNYWNIDQKQYFDELTKSLHGFGVSGHTILNYAHKPGISRELNNWTKSIKEKYDYIIPFGTVHPDDGELELELETLLDPKGYDFKGLKFQLMVTDFEPSYSKMNLVYEKLVKYNKILVIHAGTGPTIDFIINKNLEVSDHVGINKFKAILESYPTLKVQIPHMGAMETLEFFDLALNHKNLMFDTSMFFDFIGSYHSNSSKYAQFFKKVIQRIPELQDRIMFGSDYPNIPFNYKVCIDSILKLGLNKEILEKIFWKNASIFYKLKK
jgi:predicted TIM-barrel fold metal-dependent hydrolase